jgi:hypothetical protein
MDNLFIVIRDKHGIYLPKAFIARAGQQGRIEASMRRLEEGDELVVVEFKEVDIIKKI